MADGHMVAIRTALSGQSPQMFYRGLDHLGSMTALVDGNMLTPAGATNQNYTLAITRYSYDAFGMARDPVNWTPVDCTKGPQPPFVRGFTGQEHLPDNVCLINFNARMYDQQIGRFLSADPTVEAIYDPQPPGKWDQNETTFINAWQRVFGKNRNIGTNGKWTESLRKLCLRAFSAPEWNWGS